MEKRTASSIREVLRLLPEPPRIGIEERDGAPRVVVREPGAYEEEEEEDPVKLALRLRGVVDEDGHGELYSGLFLYERPSSDDLDAAWKAVPLVLHDRGLVDAGDALMSLPPYIARMTPDFSKTITKLLRRHPGPVAFFRLDSSTCPGPEMLAEWLDLLSQKAVCCLTVLNVSQSQDLEFPLHRLHGDGTLTSLCLGFFDLSRSLSLSLAQNAAATFGALDSLVLGGCTLNGQALSTVIGESRLTTLKIWGSDLTVLKITAPRLRNVELVRCRAIALTFDAPGLQLLLLGVSPATATNQTWVGVHLEPSDSLHDLNALRLDCHRISFKTAHCVIVNRRRVTSLHYMRCFNVGVEMCNAEHLSTLVGLLHSMPHLSRLSIWRTDTPNNEEGQPWMTEEAFSKCGCITQSLRALLVTDYRGSAAELTFIKGMLRYGRRLIEAIASPHPTLPLPRRKADSQLLRSSPRASAQCKVNVLRSDAM